ncbi:cyclase family protein [Leifsonia sp. NPDC056665]|uniref:cyclase family protein n=1 Tax=Leifsonia sp. NPDC056665 TaxID=3345901 RepID=UPI00369E03D9
MRVIDLSHPIRSGMTVFPGDLDVRVEPAVTIAEAGVSVLRLELGSHTGTHIDAPSHTVQGGATIDAVDLGRLVGPARVVDVSGLAPRTRIGVEDVREALREAEPGDIVLFRTGWSAQFDEPGYLDHPFLDAGIASALLDAGVTVVGVDALNPDETVADDPAPALPFHDVFLGAGGLIIENLTRLDLVTARAPRFVGLPLPIAGGDGAPLRAVVIEE